LEQATFAAGCFWHVEETFRKVKGVSSTAVGYMGGKLEKPTYEDVCSDKTGHAEVVRLEFDPRIISYDELLELFWKLHDPTQLNRQGPDIGTQYRSVIFFHNAKQKAAATSSMKKLQISKRKIATQIVPGGTFYKAEEYHQKYLMKRGLYTC